MGHRRKYMKKDKPVAAVQLQLDTDGFTYRKWGGVQTCKPGDWLVDNGGEIYTVDQESFRRTYRAVSLGVYKKVAAVWAEVADRAGTIQTKEGTTDYVAGDYLVYNEADGTDGYAVGADTFERTYRLAGAED